MIVEAHCSMRVQAQRGSRVVLRRVRPTWSSRLSMSLLACIAMGTASPALRALRAQGAPMVAQVERPIAFDSAGRVLVLSPVVAARLALAQPAWPLTSNWTEARLFRSDNAGAAMANGAVLVATLVDGAVARYALDAEALRALRVAVSAGLARNTRALGEARGDGSGFIKSEPAGNSFVRNQTLLGIVAYGPATSALLSGDGTAAGAGYLFAAGSSFFIAAKMTRSRSVTRAQTILATNAGYRGAAAGAALAAIANAHDGPGYGAPILAGALGGTIGGFIAARGMSDGEAASSGLAADMFALTTLGAGFTATRIDGDSNETARKVTLGSAIATGALGYVVGPRYARRAAYNVTAGDANIARTGALIGALAGSAVLDTKHHAQAGAAAATVGLLGGFVLSDRYLVRLRDRTSSDAGWATLGAIAGGLMGGGVAVLTKASSQPTLGLVTLGGVLGLVASDRTIAPAPDAGAVRGVMRTGLVAPGARGGREWSLVPSGRGVQVGVRF